MMDNKVFRISFLSLMLGSLVLVFACSVGTVSAQEAPSGAPMVPQQAPLAPAISPPVLTYDQIAEAKKRADEWRVSPAAGILLAQDTGAKCEFLPVASVDCPASLSPQEAAFCGIWGEGYFEFAGGKLPHCLAVEISDGKTTIWYATGQHTTQRSRPGYTERKAQVRGEVLTASWPTRLPGGLIEVEYRRDGDVLRGKYMRNNRTSLVTLPRFGK